MTTHTMCLNFLCADAVYILLEIWKRMGWQYDDLDEKMCIHVNVPIDDMELFNFIMDSFGY